MSNVLAVGWDSPSPNLRVSQKGLGEEGTVHTWWEQQSNIKEGDIVGQKGDTGV